MELTVDQVLQQGIAAHKEGKLQDAERLYRAILKAQPKHPDANHNLGVLAVAVGKPLESVPLFKVALEANPKIEQFWLSYIDALIKLEHFDEAKRVVVEGEKSGVSADRLDAFNQRLQGAVPNDKSKAAKGWTLSENRKKLAEKKKRKKRKAQGDSSGAAPSQDQINLLLGYHQAGRLKEAEELATLLIQQFPKHPIGWRALGAVYKQTGRLNESLSPMQSAVKLSPQDAEAHVNLGATLKELGRLDDAEASYRKAIALKPDYAKAHSDLGNTLYELGRLDDAEASYRKAIALTPGYAGAHSNLGNTLRELGRLDDAEASYRKAIALEPDLAEAHSNLGVTLQELGRLDEAEASYRHAIAIKPDNAEAHYNSGNTLAQLGRLDEAAEILRYAISLKPDYAVVRHNLLFALNYGHRLIASDLYKEYESFGAWAQSQISKQFDHSNRSIENKLRIRIGYSSPDFRGHACRFFMEPLFRNHDRDQFELFAYSNTPSTDQHTERMKGYFDHWVDVVRMTDEEMAQRIYDDQVDILVDMAGHTKGNRLPVFAMRPAPIQASSCIGFGYTTGLKEVDYFICDENLVPAGSEEYFSEEPCRLPAPGYAYEPPRQETPDVSQLPALRNGYVTFGSLTRTIRINDPLLRVWSEILGRVPNSRLRLDQKSFSHKGMRELFWQRLEGLGLPRERVELTCSTPHWNAYHDIDITLDCWPHNAGTTTLESLWMGVPVLSKIDRVSVGRVGVAALRPLGLEDWLVESEGHYVERAVVAASDLDVLEGLRSDLRQRLEHGRHLDAVAFTEHLEDAYRQMISSKMGGRA